MRVAGRCGPVARPLAVMQAGWGLRPLPSFRTAGGVFTIDGWDVSFISGEEFHPGRDVRARDFWKRFQPSWEFTAFMRVAVPVCSAD